MSSPVSPSAAELFRQAASAVEVVGSPYDDVVAAAGRRRRRANRRRLLGSAVVAALVVAAVAGWALLRAESEPDLVVRPSANPLEVAWWADGVLHLDDVAVELPSVTSIAEVGGGAVYTDADGVVALVGPDGERSEIGQAVPGTRVVGNPGRGLVAWLGPGGELEAYSVATETLLGRLMVREDARPVAIDQDRVYTVTPDGRGQSWDPATETAEAVSRRALLDVAAETQIYQDRDRGSIVLVPAFYSPEHHVPGQGGSLSPGGSYALTRSPGSPTGGFAPLLYEVSSGALLPDGVRPDERVLDATFGDNRTIVYALDRPSDGVILLRRCLIGGACVDVLPLEPDRARPILAH